MNKPKVLVLDIETAPIVGYAWQLWDVNIGLNQIKADWYILSFAAKWLGQPDIIQVDQRSKRPMHNDKTLVKKLVDLLDRADIIVTKNGRMFDIKKLYARAVIHGIKPPSPFKHEDVGVMVKRHFGFTSNSLEYLTDKLNTKYKKLKHKKFPGFELWEQCLARNPQAWEEMAKYNIHDVLSLEELYYIIRPWANGVNANLYNDKVTNVCNACGSSNYRKDGFTFTTSGKYQMYECGDCGAHTRGKVNLFDKPKLKSLRVGVK